MPTWLDTLRRYVAFAAAANLAWEIAHVPLYTIWEKGTAAEIAFAVLHCTVGDVLIALSCLVAALAVFGRASWPAQPAGNVTTVAVALGVAYTVYSEWWNVVVRGSWTYSNLMPVIPLVGTGVSPLLQWLVIPALGLRWARRAQRS